MLFLSPNVLPVYNFFVKRFFAINFSCIVRARNSNTNLNGLKLE